MSLWWITECKGDNRKNYGPCPFKYMRADVKARGVRAQTRGYFWPSRKSDCAKSQCTNMHFVCEQSISASGTYFAKGCFVQSESYCSSVSRELHRYSSYSTKHKPPTLHMHIYIRESLTLMQTLPFLHIIFMYIPMYVSKQ